VTETRSFTYKVSKRKDCVYVTIRTFRWKRFSIALLWSAVWLIVPVTVFETAWGNNGFGFVFILLGPLFAFFGLYKVYAALVARTLRLCPGTTLRIRTSFLGISKSRSIELGDVIQFGLGRAWTAMTPVLRLELRDPDPKKGTEWVFLVRRTTEKEVEAFLQDIKGQGFQLPGQR
jgi:hypothetical protein